VNPGTLVRRTDSCDNYDLVAKPFLTQLKDILLIKYFIYFSGPFEPGHLVGSARRQHTGRTGID